MANDMYLGDGEKNNQVLKPPNSRFVRLIGQTEGNLLLLATVAYRPAMDKSNHIDYRCEDRGKSASSRGDIGANR